MLVGRYCIRDIQEYTGAETRKHPASGIQDHILFAMTFIKTRGLQENIFFLQLKGRFKDNAMQYVLIGIVRFTRIFYELDILA
jgi:hypothetical protein